MASDPKPAPWREQLAGLHADGLTLEQVVAVTGWRKQVVRNRLCALGLRVHRVAPVAASVVAAVLEPHRERLGSWSAVARDLDVPRQSVVRARKRGLLARTLRRWLDRLASPEVTRAE
jgi:hypothetical protein